MCFTIHIHSSRDAIEKRFGVDTTALQDFQFRYFVRAFDNPRLPVITASEPQRVQLMNWGLIPDWAKDREQAMLVRKGTYNARAESLEEKPSFRKAYESGRCWIIASGFYEWQHAGKSKIPWLIQLKNEDLFAFAGIYDTWNDKSTGESVNGFSIVTTRANPMMEKIHNSGKRMPVILNQDMEKIWLEPVLKKDEASSIFLPYGQDLMKSHTIGKKITDKDADPNDPGIILPVDYYTNGTLF